jgi:hypothetical protein
VQVCHCQQFGDVFGGRLWSGVGTKFLQILIIKFGIKYEREHNINNN